MEFKVGNRVRAKNDTCWFQTHGKEGTIIYIKDSSITVEFDEHCRGHDGGARANGKLGHCWHLTSRDLELISEPAQKPKKKNNFLPTGYEKSSDGFVTNPNNWKPGNWLI